MCISESPRGCHPQLEHMMGQRERPSTDRLVSASTSQPGWQLSAHGCSGGPHCHATPCWAGGAHNQLHHLKATPLCCWRHTEPTTPPESHTTDSFVLHHPHPALLVKTNICFSFTQSLQSHYILLMTINMSIWPRATSPGDQKMALASASTPEVHVLSTTDGKDHLGTDFKLEHEGEGRNF